MPALVFFIPKVETNSAHLLAHMDRNDSLADRRKREKEFNDLTRRNQEWMEKELDALAEFLFDIWVWKKEQEKKDKRDQDGSIPAGHSAVQ